MHLQSVCPTTDGYTWCLGLYSGRCCMIEALFTLETNSLPYMYLILIQIQELKSLADEM